MDTQTAATPAATPADGATLFRALERSRSRWRVAIATPVADKVSRHKLAAGDLDALLARITGLRTTVAPRTGRGVRGVWCDEAGSDGVWLPRRLTAAGVTNPGIDPASLQLDRRARRVKTDAVEVDALRRALTALCRGARRVCSRVRVPTPQEEDAKRRNRERQQRLKERVRHLNHLKGLWATQGR